MSRTHAAFLLAASLAAGTPVRASAQDAVQPRMGEPLAGLSVAQKDRFAQGKLAFDRIFTAAQGLGPAFNDTACAHCHLGPASGGSSSKFVTRFGRAAAGGLAFDPLAILGGSLLQSQGISPGCQETIPAQADVTARRITPPTFGFGLVEAISDGDLFANEVFPPPGVSGRAHMVSALEDPPGSPARVGRFGWKAQVATLLSFSAEALLNEQGITNRLAPQENAPNGNQATLAACDAVADPEDGPDAQGMHLIDRQADFQRFLAPPPQTPRSGMSGEPIFEAVGCASCHLSTPFTASTTAEPPLAGRTLKPYSDFLLHDVGALGDGIVQGLARERELRTPPLWGLLHRGNIALLHDGRAQGGSFAQNVTSAVDWHGGEAAASRASFLALPTADRNRVIAFLASLGRAEFDYEGNNNVDEIDWFFLRPMVTGPGPAFTPDDPPAIADFDQDGDFDLRDFGWLQRAFTGL